MQGSGYKVQGTGPVLAGSWQLAARSRQQAARNWQCPCFKELNALCAMPYALRLSPYTLYILAKPLNSDPRIARFSMIEQSPHRAWLW
jgi:hypothetical protein